jgi:3-phosphoshikimate 1-carboxyvinyltransferase
MPAASVGPVRRVAARLTVPGDKSISHRYALLGALAGGVTRITGYAPGADCASTLACLESLGVGIERAGPEVTIHGAGLGGLRPARRPLDAGNSGTTLRLLAGILAGHRFESVLDGDASLRRRPMRRVREPLELMGARVSGIDDRPPLYVRGAALHGIDHQTGVPSAQVKSAVLLAGLHASGTTTVRESAQTRDHTERALETFGVDVDVAGGAVSVHGGQALTAQALSVPGDVSSAAFWWAAAAALPGSDVEVAGVGLNPTRTAILDVLRRFGALVEVSQEEASAGEPRGTVRVRHGGLSAVTILPAEVPGLIDELPVLAAIAVHGGELRVTGASELRVKESDRIARLVAGLRAMGADAEELPDGFHVRGGNRPAGGVVHASHDHRLAMAFAIAALGAGGPVTIEGAEAVDVSYPGFFAVLASVGS